MDKIYRILLGLLMFMFGLLFFIGNFIANSNDSGTSSTSDGSYTIVMILIASLVVVVVPGLFVLIRLVRR